jgi:serine/threonine protein kinase
MDDVTAPVVPGFLVGRVLGRGGSSTVWLVTEERSGRDFALKCLGEGHAGVTGSGEGRDPGADAEEAIRREIRILSVLDHQHLIKAHDALRLRRPAGSAEMAGGTIGLLLDYAPGGSLGELVGSRARLTIGETVTVLTPIAQVATCTARGSLTVIYRPGTSSLQGMASQCCPTSASRGW